MTSTKKYKVAQALTWGGSVAISAGYYLASDFRVKAALVGAGIAADALGIKLTWDAIMADRREEMRTNVSYVDNTDYNEDDIIDVDYVIVESA